MLCKLCKMFSINIYTYILEYFFVNDLYLFQIELDFNHLYPEKRFKLLNKIDVFMVKLIKYIKSVNFQFGVQGPSIIKELETPSKPGKYLNT